MYWIADTYFNLYEKLLFKKLMVITRIFDVFFPVSFSWGLYPNCLKVYVKSVFNLNKTLGIHCLRSFIHRIYRNGGNLSCCWVTDWNWAFFTTRRISCWKGYGPYIGCCSIQVSSSLGSRYLSLECHEYHWSRNWTT
jgi:hypothetical protein